MRQKETAEFSWPGLLIVTSFCFLVFSVLIKYLNGSPVHSALFFKTGIVAFVLFALTYAAGLSVKVEEKRKKERSNSRRNRMLNY
jgi:hypothetical protein